jgi:hypothetical protein
MSTPWWWETATGGGLRGDVRLHDRLGGRPQGCEGHWDAMIALSSRPFCPCDGRQVSLSYLAAGLRYTTHLEEPLDIFHSYIHI